MTYLWAGRTEASSGSATAGTGGEATDPAAAFALASSAALALASSAARSTFSGVTNRYPTFRTVPISDSCSGPSFARSRRTWTSTVRVPPK